MTFLLARWDQQRRDTQTQRHWDANATGSPATRLMRYLASPVANKAVRCAVQSFSFLVTSPWRPAVCLRRSLGNASSACVAVYPDFGWQTSDTRQGVDHTLRCNFGVPLNPVWAQPCAGSVDCAAEGRRVLPDGSQKSASGCGSRRCRGPAVGDGFPAPAPTSSWPPVAAGGEGEKGLLSMSDPPARRPETQSTGAARWRGSWYYTIQMLRTLMVHYDTRRLRCCASLRTVQRAVVLGGSAPRRPQTAPQQCRRARCRGLR